MAQQENKQVVALALNECNSTAVAEFRKQLDSVKCVADIVGLLNEDAENTRLGWVKNALVCYKGFASVAPKERGKVLDELKAKLIYGKAYIYRMRTAGEKLIAYLDKGGKAENLPYSMNEFLNDQKPEKPALDKITDLKKIGSFKIDSLEYTIYSGVRNTSDGKKKPCHIYAGVSDLTEVSVEVIGEKDGKEKTHFFRPTSGEEKPVEVSVYFINI